MCELHGNHKSKTQNIYTKPERNPFLHKHTTKENQTTIGKAKRGIIVEKRNRSKKLKLRKTRKKKENF